MSSTNLASVSRSAAFISSFSACIDDRPWIPYTNPDPKHPGDMQILINNTAQELRLTIDVVVLPWRRCLESVRSGKIDAMIGGGDVPFNRELAEFPKNGMAIDTSRSLGTARVMLVKRNGSPSGWDGSHFVNVAKPIGVAMGTQVMINAVSHAGAYADEGAKTDDQNMRKLLQHRVDLMAGYEFDLKELINKNYLGQVTVLPIPLIETHYYLAFSKPFYAKNSEFVETFWNRLSNLRDSLTDHPEAKDRDRVENSSSNTNAMR